MKKLVALCAGVVLLLANGALADLYAVGEPTEGGSWTQQFNESGVGSYDLVAVRMTSPSPDSFESLTFRSFTQSGWSTVYEELDASGNLVLATATGSDVTNMNFNIWFAGAKTNPLAFDFVAFNGDTRLESVHAVWNGGGWTIGASSWAPERAELVPVPAAVLLGLLGMGVAGLKLRKFV